MSASLLDDDADDSLLSAGERRNAIQGCIYVMRHGSTVLDVLFGQEDASQRVS